jgi:hypothetical protein
MGFSHRKCLTFKKCKKRANIMKLAYYLNGRHRYGFYILCYRIMGRLILGANIAINNITC